MCSVPTVCWCNLIVALMEHALCERAGNREPVGVFRSEGFAAAEQCRLDSGGWQHKRGNLGG